MISYTSDDEGLGSIARSVKVLLEFYLEKIITEIKYTNTHKQTTSNLQLATMESAFVPI